MNLDRVQVKLLDVFAERPFSGNGLTVFSGCGHLSGDEMQVLTCEMRQYESVFLMSEPVKGRCRARIFTMEEELDFAGHPLLGLAAHLHEEYGSREEQEWTVELNRKSVSLQTRRNAGYFHAQMDQGAPEFIRDLGGGETDEVLPYLSLDRSHRGSRNASVVSTGLPYLIVPVEKGLEQINIRPAGFETLLKKYGADFAYILDVNRREGRTWDNGGKSEDIATGSAAGPAGAWLVREGLAPADVWFQISQGRFLNRPSTLDIKVESPGGHCGRILVQGQVIKIADIKMNLMQTCDKSSLFDHDS